MNTPHLPIGLQGNQCIHLLSKQPMLYAMLTLLLEGKHLTIRTFFRAVGTLEEMD